MPMRNAILLSLVLSTAADMWVERRADSDDPLFHVQSHYIARKSHSVITVGNYIYIDGGQIYYYDRYLQQTWGASASTYSIDMSSSWTNDTVSMTQIDKDVDGIHLSSQNLFHSLDNSSFYSYNGDAPLNYSVPANKLYNFVADGAGSGLSSENTAFSTADSNFSQMSRVSAAASACGPDTCYAVGGWQNFGTKVGLDLDKIPANGIVSYNMTSQVWNNDTLSTSTFLASWSGGHLLFTDIAGSQGILIAMGGHIDGQTTVDISFDQVYLYDIASKTWHKQKTGGVVPATRFAECVVGIRGDNTVNNTYEIFMYGGETANNPSLDFDDVWVLSLPSFEWHQAGHRPVRGRGDHACTVAGQRQMVIVGGLAPYAGDPPEQADTWPLGLGVFDLSGMVFKDHFDAHASPYTSPDLVRVWYAENGYITKNVSSEVAQLFTRSKVPTTDDTTSASGSPGNTSPTNDTTKPNTNVGAIAGGVVGGVVVITGLVVGLWLILRRRRSQETREIQEVKDSSNMHVVDTHQRHEAGAPQKAPFNSWGTGSSRQHELQ